MTHARGENYSTEMWQWAATYFKVSSSLTLDFAWCGW